MNPYNLCLEIKGNTNKIQWKTQQFELLAGIHLAAIWRRFDLADGCASGYGLPQSMTNPRKLIPFRFPPPPLQGIGAPLPAPQPADGRTSAPASSPSSLCTVKGQQHAGPLCRPRRGMAPQKYFFANFCNFLLTSATFC